MTARSLSEAMEPESAGPGARVRLGDMASLIRKVGVYLSLRQERSVSFHAPWTAAELAARFEYAAGRRKGTPEVILAEDTAVELGHPSTASLSTVLVTWHPGLVRPGRITRVGPDLDGLSAGGPKPFAQVVMLEVRAGGEPDPFALDNAQYLLHRLPGYAVRSVPGKLWIRVSRKGRQAGLTLGTVGAALIAAYTADFEEIRAAEVVFVTSSRSDVEALSDVAVEARILSGRHKKLYLGADGGVECRELSCDTCEEKPVCDNLRDIVIQRRARKS